MLVQQQSKTFTKPRSQARQRAWQLIEARADMCRTLGITTAEYDGILFEAGWQFAYREYPVREARRRMSTEESGYWNIFLSHYMSQDELLLREIPDITLDEYTDIKMKLKPCSK